MQNVTKINGSDVAEPINSPSLHDIQIYGIVVTINIGKRQSAMEEGRIENGRLYRIFIL